MGLEQAPASVNRFPFWGVFSLLLGVFDKRVAELLGSIPFKGKGRYDLSSKTWTGLLVFS